MGNDPRTTTVDRLLRCFSEATARKMALEAEMSAFAARLGAAGSAPGTSCLCGGRTHQRIESSDRSVAKSSGYRNHEPGLLLLRRFCDASGEVTRLRQVLGELGVKVDL